MLVLDVHLQTLGQQQTSLIWENKEASFSFKSINYSFLNEGWIKKNKKPDPNTTQSLKALRSLITFLLYSQQKIIYNFR